MSTESRYVFKSLNGVECKLIFNLNAICFLKSEYGIVLSRVQDYLKELDETDSMDAFRKLLYAALQEHHADDERLTYKAIGALIDYHTLNDYAGIVAELINKTFPKPKEEKETGKKTKKA